MITVNYVAVERSNISVGRSSVTAASVTIIKSNCRQIQQNLLEVVDEQRKKYTLC